MKKKTNEEFLKELKTVNTNIYPLEKYNGADNKILVRCLKCNYEWHVKPNNILHGKGCPKCAIKRTHDLQRKDTDTFIKELNNINNSIKVIGNYINCHTKIKIKCLVCGNEFYSNPNTLLSGSGCRGLWCVRYATCTHGCTRRPHHTVAARLPAVLLLYPLPLLGLLYQTDRSTILFPQVRTGRRYRH